MRTERGKTEGDIELSDELVLHGMLVGNLTVTATGVLRLHGMCTGSVFVEPGGRAQLLGMVVKDVVNRGGQVEVTGMVNGTVRDEGGHTLVRPGAVVGGVRQ